MHMSQVNVDKQYYKMYLRRINSHKSYFLTADTFTEVYAFNYSQKGKVNKVVSRARSMMYVFFYIWVIS